MSAPTDICATCGHPRGDHSPLADGQYDDLKRDCCFHRVDRDPGGTQIPDDGDVCLRYCSCQRFRLKPSDGDAEDHGAGTDTGAAAATAAATVPAPSADPVLQCGECRAADRYSFDPVRHLCPDSNTIIGTTPIVTRGRFIDAFISAIDDAFYRASTDTDDLRTVGEMVADVVTTGDHNQAISELQGSDR